MTKIHILPIEPLPERYTESWYNHLPKAFEDRIDNVEAYNISGETLTDHVEVGTFLDINSTIYYKNSQMQKVAKMFREKQIQPGDIFFVSDIEFWGIESLRLLSQLNKVPILIYGFLHAASYTIEDAFAVAAPYQRFTEVGWLAACDTVFVGSDYHKRAFIERRLLPLNLPQKDQEVLASKLVVSGNPLFKGDYTRNGFLQEGQPVPKKRQVVLPNRFDWEKRPNLSLDLAYILKREDPTIEIVVCTSRPHFTSNKTWLLKLAREMESDGIITIKAGLSKAEYHALLEESAVMLSTSIEENFGYCIVEAMMYECYPLVRNSLSHPELVGWERAFLFDDEDQVVSKIQVLLEANTYRSPKPTPHGNWRDICRDRAKHYCFQPMSIMARTIERDSRHSFRG